MIASTPTTRLGVTVNEVLISLGVMAIGVTSVIAFFPIGIQRVRQAQQDTRATIMAQNAKNIIELKQLVNDPRLWSWYSSRSATNPAPDEVFDPEATSTTPAFINKWAWLANDPGGNTSRRYLSGTLNEYPNAATQDGNAMQSYTAESSSEHFKSFPILLDPLLVERGSGDLQAAASGNDYRLGIPEYYTGIGVSPTPYYDIRVATTGEASNIADKNLRRAYLTRWFSSPGDIQYSEANPIVPLNPNAATSSTIDAFDFARRDFTASPPTTTATRDYPYSWAVMLQRDLEPDPTPMTIGVPTGVPGGSYPGNSYDIPVARPPINGGFSGKTNILCFYKRDYINPVTIIDGAIFNGSNKITLSWTTATERPEVKRGTWLMEASVSRDSSTNAGNRSTGDYGTGVTSHYRRDYGFYRVVEAREPQLSSGRWFQEVLVSPTPTGYPTSHNEGDLRVTDAWQTPVWPIVENASTDVVATSSNTAPTRFYPIVIFDGLIEVY
ncbi:hypothetical protein Pan216_11330 [Planctomycetes bacterium Pan216]|uniref:Uncharacterized protein n=1 Tax=Kolteria novifilia TaxID=2527975 RepID=A0A518B018_9BACT|nr:hypothetical protein Pan216_11330 [Planctomycetes bacterium Pan216]